MTLIVDSGGLLAAMDDKQRYHEAFRNALEAADGPRIISPFVVAELAFLGEVDRGAYWLELFEEEDFSQACTLLTRYDYLLGFGIADASNVVLAERYDAFEILTIDQRDFREVAGSRNRHFRILPYRNATRSAYLWDRVSGRWHRLFEGLLRGGEMPSGRGEPWIRGRE